MVNRAGGLGETDYYTPTNIYNNNGTLTGHRAITGGGFNLTSSGLGIFQMAGNSMRLFCGASGDMVLATPKIMGNNTPPFPAVAGWYLSLADAASGKAEWAPLPSGTSSGDYASIYSTDGTIATNLVGIVRTVNLPGKTLLFLGNQSAGSTFQVAMAGGGGGLVSISAGTNDIYGTGMSRIGGALATVINTPGTYANAAARNGWVLGWDGSKSEYIPVNTGADTSIYNTNGTLTGPRVLTGANNDLTFGGVRNLWLEGGTSLKLVSPKVVTGSGDRQIGYVATMKNIDGSMDWEALPGGIYGTNGTMTGVNPRQVNGAGYSMLWTGFSSYEIDSASTRIRGPSGLKLNPSGGASANGMVLTATDADGTATWQNLPGTATTLYTGISSLTGSNPRVVDLNQRTLTFQGGVNSAVNFANPVNFDVTATTRIDLNSTGELNLKGTPLRVKPGNLGSSFAGWFLKLKTAADGEAEWAPVPGAQNIYTQDGSLGPSGTDRVFDGASGARSLKLWQFNNLTLSGVHSRLEGTADIVISGQNSTTVSGGIMSVSGGTTTVLGSSSVDVQSPLTTVGVGTATTGSVKIKTPRINQTGTNKAVVGQVLKLSNADGTVEYADDLGSVGGNIYVGKTDVPSPIANSYYFTATSSLCITKLNRQPLPIPTGQHFMFIFLVPPVFGQIHPTLLFTWLWVTAVTNECSLQIIQT
jgi:hypothetical protein